MSHVLAVVHISTGHPALLHEKPSVEQTAVRFSPAPCAGGSFRKKADQPVSTPRPAPRVPFNALLGFAPSDLGIGTAPAYINHISKIRGPGWCLVGNEETTTIDIGLLIYYDIIVYDTL